VQHRWRRKLHERSQYSNTGSPDVSDAFASCKISLLVSGPGFPPRISRCRRRRACDTAGSAIAQRQAHPFERRRSRRIARFRRVPMGRSSAARSCRQFSGPSLPAEGSVNSGPHCDSSICRNAETFRCGDAYFRPSWTAFQAGRGRCFSVIMDGVSAGSWTVRVRAGVFLAGMGLRNFRVAP
jgi:hypothetical protein